MHAAIFRTGATETVEGGDQLSAGLGPPVVVRQSAWRRAGEMLRKKKQPTHSRRKCIWDIFICHLHLTLMSFRGGDQLRMSSP